jgi:hypothetical protein
MLLDLTSGDCSNKTPKILRIPLLSAGRVFVNLSAGFESLNSLKFNGLRVVTLMMNLLNL